MNASPDSRKKAIAREVSIVAAYLVLTGIATYPLVIKFDTAVPPGGDSWLYYWNLWWVKRALVDLHVSPLFTQDLYFPYGTSLYFHTLNLFPSIIALPISATVGLPAAYNFLVFLAFTLSGYGMYRLTLYVLATDIDPSGVPHHTSTACLAAFVAGMAFTFSSYHFAHLHGHLDLLSTQWLPLFVLFLLKTRDGRHSANPILCGMFLAATALTTEYYLMFLLVFTAIFIVHTSISRGRESYHVTGRIAIGFAVFAVVTAPVLVPTLIMGRSAGRAFDPAADIVTFSTDALAFFVPSPLHPVWGRDVSALYRTLFGEIAGYEHVAFLGYVPLLLAAIAVARSKALTFWLTAAGLFALLALGPIAHAGGRVVPVLSIAMPYQAIARLPYGDIPRVPVRFVVMAQLCLSVLAGCGAWFVLRHLNSPNRWLVAATLAGLLLAENAAVPLPIAVVDVPAWFDRLGAAPDRQGLLEVPIPDDPAIYPRRMLFQTRHDKPVYQGYLARGSPPIRFDLVPGFRQFKVLSPDIDDVVSYDARQLPAISRAALAAYGAGRVVIEKPFMIEAAVERARGIADQLFGAAAREYEDSFTIAYAIPHQDTVPKALWLDTGWSYLERLDTDDSAKVLQWRWMGEGARIAVLSDAAAHVSLRLSAVALGGLRHLALSIHGAEIGTLAITSDLADYETPRFHIPGGLVFVDLKSIEPAESPGADPRHLSVALYRIGLVE